MNMRIPAVIALFLAALLATRVTAETAVPQTSATVALRPKVEDVWVAFKTHFDIGYTDTIEGVLRKYRVQMMDGCAGDHRPGAAIAAGETVRLDRSGLAARAHPRSAAGAGSPGPHRAGGPGRNARGPSPAVQPAHGDLATWKTWCGDCDSRRRSPASTAGRCPSRRR